MPACVDLLSKPAERELVEPGVAGTGKLRLWFRREHRGIAGEILDLLHWNNDDFTGGIHFQHFHVVADCVTHGIFDQELLIVHEHNFNPILHSATSFPKEVTICGRTVVAGALYGPW